MLEVCLNKRIGLSKIMISLVREVAVGEQCAIDDICIDGNAACLGGFCRCLPGFEQRNRACSE